MFGGKTVVVRASASANSVHSSTTDQRGAVVGMRGRTGDREKAPFRDSFRDDGYNQYERKYPIWHNADWHYEC